MQTLRFAAVLTLLVLAGCGNPIVQAIVGGDLTDLVIKRAEGFSDRALEDLEAAEDFMRQKTVRLALAKCRFPYTALVRYGCKSEANRLSVETDCGLAVRCNTGTVTRPLAAKATGALQGAIAGGPPATLGGRPPDPPR